jgi:uncharacterized protein YkwD
MRRHQAVNKMRIAGNIFIIIFVIVSVYLLRNDVVIFYHNVRSEISSIDASLLQNFSPHQDTALDHPETKVSTPGPLEVFRKIVGGEKGLTISGVISATNQNRKDNGNLPALKENSKLDASAKMKLDDMFAKQYFEHVSPDGKGVADLAAEVGYEYIVIGENLALGGFADDNDLVDAWMNSPGHRANILNDRYTEIGVAVGKGMYNGKLTWLAVQHFGMPRSSCPTLDQVLKASIVALESKLTALESQLSAIRKDLSSGVYVGDAYKEKTDEYNALVTQYNQQAAIVREKISTYNAEVKAFNACAEAK